MNTIRLFRNPKQRGGYCVCKFTPPLLSPPLHLRDTSLISSVHSVVMQISSLILMHVISANDEGAGPLVHSLAPSNTVGPLLIIEDMLTETDSLCVPVLLSLWGHFLLVSDLETKVNFASRGYCWLVLTLLRANFMADKQFPHCYFCCYDSGLYQIEWQSADVMMMKI